jgi:FkbM family methyltransferase
VRSSLAQNMILGSYRFVRRSGLLETSLGSELFASAYFLYKRYEDHLRGLLRAYPGLTLGGNVLDIGANIGYTATVLACSVEHDRLVYAFEPEPFNYRMLMRTAGRPQLEGRIVAQQCAVGAVDGTAQLWLNTSHPADHRVMTGQFQGTASARDHVTVPIVSIDSFLQRHEGPVSFAKIDVQGFEYPVCQGMRTTLEQNPDLSILLEYAPGSMRALGFCPADLLELLSEYGFKPYVVGPNGKLSPEIPAVMNESAYIDLLFIRNPARINRGS